MITLEEAIIHAEEVAKEKDKHAKVMEKRFGQHCAGYGMYAECANEHRQLAEWLKDYKRMLESAQNVSNDDLISRKMAIEAIENMDIPEDMCVFEIISHIEVELSILPSAQPEIIRCKDCKWKEGSECVRFADIRPFPTDFCSRAERREDGSD